MEEVTLYEDATDSVKLVEQIHETVVDVRCDYNGGEKLVENVIEDFVKIVIIDVPDYLDESDTPDEYRVEEICYTIEPLTSIHEVKQNITKALMMLNIDPADLNGFNLGCMSSLNEDISLLSINESSIHHIIEKSVPIYFLAALFLDYVYEHIENEEIKEQLKYQNEHLLNACSVLENALKVHDWPVPDLKPTRRKFDELEAKLDDFVEEFLKSAPEIRFESTDGKEAGSDLLRPQKQLIINYEIVSEIEYAVSDLQDVFGTIKAEVQD